ncbi:SDR family NAD(P)-dependent oxidoreductase [Actinomadura chibensis]|uniref:SDR family oxidoreductase n=1 Tax=Actinomadura chibensis TaxID=392828 RepID=A0A5D0NI87_9ACTN|nr:SDR family oxidoreductase [Actinomadura chibensis]TYB44092.1 SDR family oxidoreductase [Actinomadura chibensis]
MTGLPGLFALDGRVAIVTGASSGIGRHMCRVLAEAGATVVAAARRESRLRELSAADDRIVAVACDVTSSADCARAVERAADFGGPDVLVNAAGFGDPVPALELQVEEFRRTLDVDLTGTFEMSAQAARAMRGRGGSIVNIASILGLGASWPVSQAAYCAAKGGVVNLTRQLGAEWADEGIRVNAIAPGWFPSELTEEMFADGKAMRWLTRNTPMRRPGRLDELDGALLLLASDAGAFITGQTIAVDGGWTAR